MGSILSLGRSRIAGVFAWLALLSLGALGAVQTPANAQAFDGAAKASIVRALVDAPVHVGRLAAVKLTPHHRPADDPRRHAPGPDPMLPVAAVTLAARSAGAIAFTTAPLAQIADWHGTPYSARAPPLHSIG